MAAANAKASRDAYYESTRADRTEAAAPSRSEGARWVCDKAGTSGFETTGTGPFETAGFEERSCKQERAASHLWGRPWRL